MNWLNQIFISFSLIAGTVIGESFSVKAFGKPKGIMSVLIQMFLFVSLVVVLLNSFLVYELNQTLLILVYFMISLFSILFANGATTLLGSCSIKVKNVVSRERSEESKVIGAYMVLKRKGVSDSDVKESLKQAGFKKVDEIIKNFKSLNK